MLSILDDGVVKGHAHALSIDGDGLSLSVANGIGKVSAGPTVMHTNSVQTVTGAKFFQYGKLAVHAVGNVFYHFIRSLSSGSNTIDIPDTSGLFMVSNTAPSTDGRQVATSNGDGVGYTPRLVALGADVTPRRGVCIQKDGIGSATGVLVGSVDWAIVQDGTTVVDTTDALGNYNLCTSLASTNANAGLSCLSNYGVQTRQNPCCTFRVFTGSSLATMRLWAGIFSSNPAGSATPAVTYAALRYVPATDGTAYWRFVTDSGTGAPQVTITTAAIAVSSVYNVRIWYDPVTATWNLDIEGIIYASHAAGGGAVPGSSTTMYPMIRIRTLEPVAKAVGWDMFDVRHN